MIEVDGIQTDYSCPECSAKLVFDVYLKAGDVCLVVHIYCENDSCDYYTHNEIDPITPVYY